MTSFRNTLEIIWWNLLHRMGWADIMDILIVAIIIFELLKLMRQTRSSQVLKGFALLFLAAGFSSLLGLTSLNWILKNVLNNSVLVLLVLFQPEIRKALETLGRGALMEHHASGGNEEMQTIITELTQAITDMSRRKVGALIVFEQKTGLRDVIETGTAIDGRISAPLLENIFEHNTPLHDGAVVISGDRVVAAACILPLTERNNVDRDLGTRHRSAIGVSETTDAVVLVVSEETGDISCAHLGQLQRHMDVVSLKEILQNLFEKPNRSLWSMLTRNLRQKKAGVNQEGGAGK